MHGRDTAGVGGATRRRGLWVRDQRKIPGEGAARGGGMLGDYLTEIPDREPLRGR